MNSFQMYIIPAVFITYLVYRVMKFKKVKSMMPKYLEQGALVVDVRSPAEYNSASAPGSLNIPLNQIQTRANELDPSRLILVCCASGTRSGIAAGILKQQGFKNVVNAGPWTNVLA